MIKLHIKRKMLRKKIYIKMISFIKHNVLQEIILVNYAYNKLNITIYIFSFFKYHLILYFCKAI